MINVRQRPTSAPIGTPFSTCVPPTSSTSVRSAATTPTESEFSPIATPSMCRTGTPSSDSWRMALNHSTFPKCCITGAHTRARARTGRTRPTNRFARSGTCSSSGWRPSDGLTCTTSSNSRFRAGYRSCGFEGVVLNPLRTTIVVRGPAAAAYAHIATVKRATAYPFATAHAIGSVSIEELRSLTDELEDGLVAVMAHEVEPEGDEWPWEAQGLMELHPDTVLVSARILNRDRLVVAGGEVFARDGSPVCPDFGRQEADPGPWALSLKQRSASAVHGGFFVADARFLRRTVDDLPADAITEHLGVWLGAAALAAGLRVAFSPLVTGVARLPFSGAQELAGDEREMFYRRYGDLFPASTWYPGNLTRFGPGRRG